MTCLWASFCCGFLFFTYIIVAFVSVFLLVLLILLYQFIQVFSCFSEFLIFTIFLWCNFIPLLSTIAYHTLVSCSAIDGHPFCFQLFVTPQSAVHAYFDMFLPFKSGEFEAQRREGTCWRSHSHLVSRGSQLLPLTPGCQPRAFYPILSFSCWQHLVG